MDKGYTYEEVQEIANFVKSKISIVPTIGIICGSGLGSVGELVTNPTILDYKNIPNFPQSTVIGHAGRLIFGHIQNIPVMCMQGRFHFYEGHSLSSCTMPVRLMKLLGVSIMIVSNAAGSTNPSYKTGDIMLIKDHVNFVGLAGNSPLRGHNDERFGPRFIPMNKAYDNRMIQEAKTAAKEIGLERIQEGVYCSVGGPCFESVAEIKLLKALGVDAVGMSTVHEVVVARHCDIACFGFSLITNEGVAEYDVEDQPDGDHVVQVAEGNQDRLKAFVEKLVPRLAAVQTV